MIFFNILKIFLASAISEKTKHFWERETPQAASKVCVELKQRR